MGDHLWMAESDAKLEFDRRKSERAETNEVAFISVAGSSTRCQIVNVSSDGAAVDVPDAAYIPSRFRLMTERDRVVRNCRIAWISENRIGVGRHPALRFELRHGAVLPARRQPARVYSPRTASSPLENRLT